MESSFVLDYANPKPGKLQFLLRHYTRGLKESLEQAQRQHREMVERHQREHTESLRRCNALSQDYSRITSERDWVRRRAVQTLKATCDPWIEAAFREDRGVLGSDMATEARSKA